MKPHRFTLIYCAVLLLGMTGLFALPLPAEASTFVVNTYDDLDDGQCDSNHCSLREAINAANANSGPDEIHFDLPGSGGSNTIIYLTSPLPALTDDATTIDGTTEPDYAGSPVFGIQDGMPGIEVGLDLQSNDNIIRGLSLNGFGTFPPEQVFDFHDPIGSAILAAGSGNLIQENRIGSGALQNAVGVRIYGAHNSVIGNVISGNGIGVYSDGSSTEIRGNIIGPAADGVTPVYNDYGIVLDSGALSADIGGVGPGEGNLISANEIIAILSQSADNQIHGNLIGVDATGTAPLPNYYGVSIQGANAWIGGSLPQHSNVISGNERWGIAVEQGGQNAVIQGNKIGTDISGSVMIPNQAQGIVSSADGVVIGGASPGEGNLIMGNAGHGVNIADGASGNLVAKNTIADNGQDGIYLNSAIPYYGYLTQNTFTQNSIYNNGGLGITIMPGHNGNIQPPQITSPQDSTIEGTAWYSCKIEIFRAEPDPSGYGEGKVFLAEGYTTETDDTFSIPISSPGYCFMITATATDSLGNTSEFSQNATAKCFVKPPDIFLYPIWVFIIVVFAFIAWRIRRRRPGMPAWSIPIGGLIGGLLAFALFIALPFAEPEPPPGAPICGNGVVDSGEQCDGDDLTMCLEGQVCENCKCITYVDQCGNGVVDSGEQCDGDDLHMCLSGQVCENCKCITYLPMCGNGVVEQGEQCDGDDLTMCLSGQVCENCKCITYVEAESENKLCVYEALQNSNCRASDYPESELVETLMEGDSADLIALNPEYTHGLFKLENGKQCWVWLGLMGGDENPFGNCPVEIVDPPETPPMSACTRDMDQRACIAAGGEWIVGDTTYCDCPEE
jgi:CSLREA domain-containing protein